MSFLAASNFTVYLKDVFADWAIALFIFFAVLIVLAVLFKGLKLGIKLFIIAAVIAGGFILAAFINMLVTWETLRIVDFAVKWAPTILFVTIITISTLVNAKRGLRKSLILLTHAVIACVICTVFYYFCANSESVDKDILSIINASGNSLQKMLGVSAECTTVREIFAEYLPKLLGGDLQILIAENPQYIVTLADMAFKIVFAFITVILYFLLVFFMYVIYFFAYPERRHKKKVNRAVANNTADRPYTKNHIGGGVVGLVRGITVGLLSLSFIGSALFIVAGGKGNGTLGDYDFENDDYNYYYSIYRSIESYGSQGIFKILNLMTDSSDTPFYLFAADMVLSGKLNDEENDINNENIKFREELAAFIGFAKDTMNLMMKYGADDLVAIINGNGGDNAFDTIVDILCIPEFRMEFDDLIREFDSQTYIINLGMSLVSAIVDNIDDISFTSSISADNRELIKILFKKGYLSDEIPDEQKIKLDVAMGNIAPTEYKVRPYIKVSHLLNKNDVRLILKIALSFISGEQQTDDVLNMVKSLLPEVKQLSILQTSRAKELDPVLSRMYCYIENKYLTAEGESGITYEAVANENIKWLDEINVLLDVAGDALTLWDNIYEEDKDALDIALSIFDTAGSDYAENVRCFNNIRYALERSKIIGTALSTSYVYDMLIKALSTVSENIYIPENLVYNTTVNADGSVTNGEMYQLFGGFKLLNSPKNRRLLDKVLDIIDGKDIDIAEFLDELSAALTTTDEDGNTLSSYLTESHLLRSALSVIMIESGEGVLYVPSVSLDKLANGKTVNMINKEELKYLFDSLPDIIDFAKPLLDGNVIRIGLADIAEFLQGEKFDGLLENSRICEGTIANVLMESIKNIEYIAMPNHLIENIDGWVTKAAANGRKEKGELRKLLDSFKLLNIDFEEISNGEFNVNSLIDTLISFDNKTAENFFASEILHYTVSKYLIDAEIGGFEIIVPNSARNKAQEGDSIAYIVKKSEILNLFNVIARLELSDEIDISSVLCKVVANKDIFEASTIISASIVYVLSNNADIKDVITIPENYLKAGEKSALEYYNSSNIWKAELPRFIDALDEILGISENGEDFVFDSESILSSLSNLLTELNEASYLKPELTKLRLCYLSDIIKSEITVRLDQAFLDSGIVTEEVIGEAKSHGYYKREELQSFAYALEIFEIKDLLNLDSSEIISKVTAMALDLNKALPDYDGKTGLELIYPSQIISYIFSNEIDKALEGFIEQEVVNYIKGGRNTYLREDIAAFIDAVNELGIEDFDSLKNFNIADIGNLNSPAQLDENRTRLDVIYSSHIAAGVITKSVYDILNSGDISGEVIDHSKAYENGVKIYRIEEIESIYYIFSDLENIDIKNVDIGKIGERLYDENGVTRSYLLASAASALFKGNNKMIIPVDVLDEEGCIMPRESALIISVFKDVYNGDDENFEDMEDWEITEIPSGETRQKMFSSVIMRATITFNLGEKSSDNGESIYISNSEEYVKAVLDIDNKLRLIISEQELNALADALETLSISSSSQEIFEVPKFNSLNDIMDYNVEVLLKSDIMYYRMSEYLLGDNTFTAYLEFNGVSAVTQEAIELSTGRSSDQNVIPKETILDFYRYYQTLAVI